MGILTLRMAIWKPIFDQFLKNIKIAIFTETVRDRVKQREFFYPCRFTTYKITTFENINLGSHDPSRRHDLGNVNCPLSWKLLEIEQSFEPCGLTTYTITTFKNIDFGVT